MGGPNKWARNSLILSDYRKKSSIYMSINLKKSFFQEKEEYSSYYSSESAFIIECDSMIKII